MPANTLILDIATAPIADADNYLDGTVRAPSTYKDPEKIKAYIEEKTAERVAMAGVDLDLARVTGVGFTTDGWSGIGVELARDEDAERSTLAHVASLIDPYKTVIVTFGGLNFDMPLLMRRARYLNVPFPALSLDRYRSPHIDLCELLSDRNPQRRRSLDFYAKRMGWNDLNPKPLSGADEAQVPVTGRWDELAASIKRDVTATYRLACWLDVIAAPVPEWTAEHEAVGL